MLDNKKTKTDLSELGEFGLIKHITKDFKTYHASTIKGVGDDAAVLEYKDKQIVVTTDLLIEGIHFNLMYVPLKHLGYKSVIVNLSDVYAMNAEPRQITVSFAVSNRFPLEAIAELYEGIKTACDKYNIDLIGGDTSSSVTGLIISVTAIGEVEKDRIAYRNTAKKGDLLCVSGDLGAAYMGLQLLEREKEVYKSNPNMQPELEGYDYILQRQLRPEARRDVVGQFHKLNLVPTSMIDISDGLSSEILHICNNSDVGCKLIASRVPIAPETQKMAREFDIEPIIAALSGGEDYELLFTVNQADYDKVVQCPDVIIIGHITDKNEGINMILDDGTPTPIIAQGWNAMERHN